MGIYYELRLSGKLKLPKDKSTAVKLASWFRDVRDDNTEEDQEDNVRYFKFDKTDFELDSGLSNFLRINKDDIWELKDLEIFKHMRYFGNSYIDSPIKKIIMEENDIFTIDMCIGNNNKKNELFTLIFLLLEFAEDGFKIMLYDEIYIYCLVNDSKINNWKLSSEAADKYASLEYSFDDIIEHELKCDKIEKDDERAFIRSGLEID